MDTASPARPTVIDLFAGVGGLSLGAARAGFHVALAVELDKFAFAAHRRNFPGTVHSRSDVAKLKGERLLKLSKLKRGELTGLIGGPPCQGFSSIGKKDQYDPRNDLFVQFFRLVSETQPLFFLAENVPGILTPRYRDILTESRKLIQDEYVMLDPIRVVASDYGAPTSRKRVFFIGFRKGAGFRFDCTDFLPIEDTLEVKVAEALRGLPEEIDSEWKVEKEILIAVEKRLTSAFEERISGLIPPGVGSKRAIQRYQKYSLVSGCQGTKHTAELEARYASLIPGVKDPISRAVRLHPDRFCPTLRAGTANDRGSFQAVRPIHPTQPRVITPREAARLQGFPDWFTFDKTKWHSFRQIGNSVSPIVSEYLLSVVQRKILEGSLAEITGELPTSSRSRSSPPMSVPLL